MSACFFSVLQHIKCGNVNLCVSCTQGQATALKLQPTAVQASEAAGRHRIAVELRKAHQKITHKISAASKSLSNLQDSQVGLLNLKFSLYS